MKCLAQHILERKTSELDSFLKKQSKDVEWLRVNVLFEKTCHRLVATSSLARIGKQLPDNIRIHSDLWALCTLNNRNYQRLAIKCGERSSMIWFSGTSGDFQTQMLEEWVSTDAKPMKRPRALVVQLERTGKDDASFIYQLQDIAVGHDLQLFLQSFPQGGFNSQSGPVTIPFPIIEKQALDASGEARFYGINE